MKKIIAILMSVLMLVGLCACGNNSSTTNDGTTDKEKGGQYGEVVKSENVELREADGTLTKQAFANFDYEISKKSDYKDQNIKIEITGLEVTDENVTVNYTIENKADETLFFTVRGVDSYVNGYAVSASRTTNSVNFEIPAKTTANEKLIFSLNELAKSDITYISNIMFQIGYCKQSYNGEDEKWVTMSLKTNCDETNKQYKDGTVIYDGAEAKITAQYVGWEESKTKPNTETVTKIGLLRFLVEDKKDEKQSSLELCKMYVNGSEDNTLLSYSSGYGYCFTEDGMNIYKTFWFDRSDRNVREVFENTDTINQVTIVYKVNNGEELTATIDVNFKVNK